MYVLFNDVSKGSQNSRKIFTFISLEKNCATWPFQRSKGFRIEAVKRGKC